jgi:hypothetical protein
MATKTAYDLTNDPIAANERLRTEAHAALEQLVSACIAERAWATVSVEINIEAGMLKTLKDIRVNKRR